MRRYIFEKVLNFRDLGGYPIPGGETKYGVFFRCAAPLGFSEEEAARLAALHISDVIDLRGEKERTEQPNAFAALTQVHHIPFLGEGKELPKTDEEVPLSYWNVAHHPNMKKVMDALLAAKGGAVFHCSAGKDRTGTVAALLGLLAGMSDEDLVADYILSQAYIRKLITFLVKTYPTYPMALINPKAENMEGFLNLFWAEYQTPEDYFVKIGFSGEEISKFKKKFC